MPHYSLVFDNPVIEFNTSLQIGDMVYFVPAPLFGTSGFNMGDLSNLTVIGVLEEINSPFYPTANLLVNSGTTTLNVLPNQGDFIMFSKDNKANLSSLLGYVAEARFENNSKHKAELFSVGAEVSESSK
jgi:hypothetical protein